MNVKDRLPPITICIQDYPISGVMDPLAPSDVPGEQDEVADQLGIGRVVQ
jgi:hypothetical protein